MPFHRPPICRVVDGADQLDGKGFGLARHAAKVSTLGAGNYGTAAQRIQAQRIQFVERNGAQPLQLHRFSNALAN
jgi:hypothetical protein